MKTWGSFLYFYNMTKLDEILTEVGASNHDVVEMNPEHLNHKMVQKARLGKKPVPRHTQDLILQAVNDLLRVKEVEGAKTYKRVDIFANDELQMSNDK